MLLQNTLLSKPNIIKNYMKIFFILLFSAILTHNMYAQVTIGSSNLPNQGALLDLKQENKNGANSSKGIALPRVKLVSKTALFPMLSAADTTDISYKSHHAGLVVYNTNNCKPFGAGLYVWEGSKWEGINLNTSLDVPSVSFTELNGTIITLGMNGAPDTIHIASGLDKRGASIPAIEFNAGWAPATAVAALTATNAYSSNGAMFSTTPWSNGINSLTSSPHASESLLVENMSTISGITNTPWKTRQWRLKYDIPGNECNDNQAVTKELILNQTNYAISVGTSSASQSPSPSSISLYSTAARTIYLYSNVVWEANATPESGATITDLFNMSGTNTELNIRKGTIDQSDSYSRTSFKYTPAGNGVGSKYKKATVTFSDVFSRANDVEVTFQQCMGTFDDSSITSWGSEDQNVHSHTYAYSGAPSTFYSGWFGAAGRWMITNLDATGYDPIRTDIYGVKKSDPTWSYTNSHTVPYIGHVNGSSPTDNTYYKQNKHMGILYNFAAASMSVKNSVNTNEGGISITRVQGICPNGWHLPSDYEWTELENEIIRNTTRYANVATNISPDGVTGLLPQDNYTINGRGTTHGQAMKDICPVPTITQDTRGASNIPSSNGFSVPLPGVLISSILDYGNYTAFWTASTAPSPQNNEYAWGRNFQRTTSNVERYYGTRHRMFSVRCKMDN